MTAAVGGAPATVIAAPRGSRSTSGGAALTMGERTMGALARGDALLGDRVDPLFFKVYRTRAPATRTVRVWARAAERLEAARARQPESFQEISYTRLIENPIGVVRDLYASLGYALTEPVVQRMQQWLADNPQGKHGKHTYSLESVGLDPKQVDATLGPYIKRYGFSR